MKHLSALAVLILAAPASLTQTRKTPAPIVDGPDYLASRAPATVPPTPKDPAPPCMAAIQVIGHNMEAVQSMPRYVDSEDAMDQVHYWLQLDTMAGNLVDAMNDITHNSTDGTHCQKEINAMLRLYPDWRDKQDQMSTGRLVTIMTVMRLMAGQKAQMEVEASRDVSH